LPGRLNLDAYTTECRRNGSDLAQKANLAKLESTDCSLLAGSERVHPALVVRDLGVLLDANLTMKQYVNKTAAACYTTHYGD